MEVEKVPLIEKDDECSSETSCENEEKSELSLKFFVIFFLVLVLFGSLLYLKIDDRHVGIKDSAAISSVVISEEPDENCESEEWNSKRTDSFPYYEEYKRWARSGLTGVDGMFEGELRLISAFLYDDYIVVTTTLQDKNRLGAPVYCRYFDCNRRELPGSMFQSFFFPMTAAHCARRAAAKYMSLTLAPQDEPQEPIPLVTRMFSKPRHEVGVCVGQIYGDERKWLEIVEFVEHHRLVGASMFYFTVYEMDGYTEKVMEEYERLGLGEVSFVHTEYKAINILFHQIQLNECFFRSKYHSKWVINVDIDERLTLTEASLFRPFLRRLHPSVCELIFASRRVPKLESSPEKFENETKLLEDMEFLRYQNTTPPYWPAPKIVFKPARVHSIYMHWSWRQQPGCRVASVPVWLGYARHYRIVKKEGMANDWLGLFNTSSHFPLDPAFAQQLKTAVVDRVKYLYDLKPILCDKIEEFFRKNYGNDTLKCF